MNINIIFFSNLCQCSKIFLNLLNGENLTRFFTLVCTDNNPNIPSEITVTPTMYIKGCTTPYVAETAFAWFQKIKQWKMQMKMQHMASTQQTMIQNNMGGNQSALDVIGFNKDEMAGMSDMFAFMTDDNVPHSHFEYNDMGSGKDKIIIYGRQKDSEIKITESEQRALLSKAVSSRDKETKEIKQQYDNFIKTCGK